MLSELKLFRTMGGSNSEVFLSEKDPNDHEFHILIRPDLEFDHEECQASTPEDDDEPTQKQLEESDQEKNDHEDVQERDQEEDKDHEQCNIVPVRGALKIKTTPYEDLEERDEDDPNDEGFRTPTSSDHKIPVIPECPPAPRKPKSVASTKRKACRPRLVLDLSREIESLFPTPPVVDLGAKIKKVKQGNDRDNGGERVVSHTV